MIMTRTCPAISMAVFLALSATATLCAAEGGPFKNNDPTISGTLIAIDVTAPTVTVKNDADGKETIMVFNHHSCVTVDNANASVADLKVGDKAYIRFEKNIAKSVSVLHQYAPRPGK